MYSKQGALIQQFYEALEPRAADAMFALLGQCQHDLEHRGTLAILKTQPQGASGAVLTVANYAIPPDNLTTEYPSNGLAADFIGKVRFRGQVQFDQGGALQNFADLLALFPVGFQMPWHDAGDIPAGWAIMDGVANASGSGIDRGGKVGYGYISGDATFGTLGADVAIALSWAGSPISGGSAVSLTIDNESSHTHSISVAEFASQIQISNNHAASSGGTTIDTDTRSLSISPSPTTQDLAHGADGNYYVWLTSGGIPAISANPHDHPIPKADIAGALAAHTVSIAGDLDSTAGSHNHTGTVATTSIAAQLTIGTPSTVRPPGVVELWIEKLPA